MRLGCQKYKFLPKPTCWSASLCGCCSLRSGNDWINCWSRNIICTALGLAAKASGMWPNWMANGSLCLASAPRPSRSKRAKSGWAGRRASVPAAGCTSGFGRASRDFYVEHGQPKELYLRELEKGAGSYQAFEDECSKLTQRQLKALGCRYHENKQAYLPPSDSTFLRVLDQVEASAFDLAVGRWMIEQEISVLDCRAGSAR